MAVAELRDGCPIAFEEAGSGPPMILVHGITESRRSWDPLLPALGGAFRVVSLDLRGHGESGRRPPYDALTMAEDVRELAGQLGLERVILVGHSLGAVVVTACAASWSGAAGVVNVDQPLRLGDFHDVLRSIEPALRSSEQSCAEVVRSVLDAMMGPLAPSERERLVAISTPEQEVVLGVWSTVLETDPGELEVLMRGISSAVTVPYLAIHGSDPGPGYGEWLSSSMPQSVLEMWPDHGHYPHLVDPERFLERVLAFSRSLA